MTIFGSHDLAEPEISDQKIALALDEIRENARNRRLACIAPVALVAAVLAAFLASPQRYGGLTLVSDASASDPALPRVFGADGVWRLPETIAEGQVLAPNGPASIVEAPAEPAAPSYILVPPTNQDIYSLPVSTSTPPTSTPGQSLAAAIEAAVVFGTGPWPAPTFLPIVIEQAATEGVAVAEQQPATPTISTPEISASVEETTTPALSSPDEDVSVVETQPRIEPTGDDTASVVAVVGDPSEANPSTPADDPAVEESQPLSQAASIVPLTVLVHSAHVSVTVQVVDDDSSVIDWCNTRVDWGDGSVSRVTLAEEVDACATPCVQASTASVAGIDEVLVFEHHYSSAIDAAPLIYVATGDSCDFNLAELQLRRFTVVPY